MKRLLLAAAVAATALMPTRQAAAQEAVVLKFGSLAPDGSSWANLLKEWGRKVEEHTSGKVKVKFYLGGQSGDERDYVRKIKLGNLSGAVVTAIGLGLIQPEVRALELPMLIRTNEELDYVRTKLDGEIRKKFEEKGFVLLSWGDVGPIHIFSNIPLKSKADLAQTKLWAWTDDPMVRALFTKLGTPGVPLGVPDVLPSLQTGMINACYGSPLSTLALQWHTKVKYVTALHISQAIGATVLSKKDWDKIPPDMQKIVMQDAADLQVKVLKTIRQDNSDALKKLLAQGIQQVESPAAMVSEFEQVAVGIRSELEGSLYSKEFRNRVEARVKEFRAGKK